MFWAYTIRNLIARRKFVLPIMLAVFATVGAITLMLALLEGLSKSIRETHNPGHAMVLRQGALDETGSAIAPPLLQKIRVAPGVAMADGVEQVSSELVIPLKFRQPDGQIRTVTVRGIDPIAVKIHGIRITSGHGLAHSEPGFLLGASQVGQLEGFSLGGEVRIGRQKWPVVGIFERPGSVTESEIWCDRTALMSYLKRPTFSVAHVVLERAEAQAGFANAIDKIGDAPLQGMSQASYLARAFSSLDLYLNAILIVSIILGLGAVFACTNSMYAAFLGRTRELATLIAIGYTRRRVALLMLQESFFVAFVSGSIGLLVGALGVHGRTLSFSSTLYVAHVSTQVLLLGAGVSVLIGVLSAIVSVFQVWRLHVLTALRAL